MAISKVISIQEMTSFIQSAIIYDQISSDNTVFAFYNLYNSKFVHLFIPRMANDIRPFIISEYSPSWLTFVQLFEQTLNRFCFDCNVSTFL